MGKPGRKPGTPKTGGRKKGTANKANREIREIAQEYGPAAIRRAALLGGIAKPKADEVGPASSETAQIAALGIVLDRAYGKPPQAITGANGGPLELLAQFARLTDEQLEEIVARAHSHASEG